MNKLISALIATTFAMGTAFAQTPASTAASTVPAVAKTAAGDAKTATPAAEKKAAVPGEVTKKKHHMGNKKPADGGVKTDAKADAKTDAAKAAMTK